MNSGTTKSSAPAPKRNAAPVESVTLPPAAVTTAWPAATSHSQVGGKDGLNHARPPATQQHFTAEPRLFRTAPGLASWNESQRQSPSGRYSRAGRGLPATGAIRVWI